MLGCWPEAHFRPHRLRSCGLPVLSRVSSGGPGTRRVPLHGASSLRCGILASRHALGLLPGASRLLRKRRPLPPASQLEAIDNGGSDARLRKDPDGVGGWEGFGVEAFEEVFHCGDCRVSGGP